MRAGMMRLFHFLVLAEGSTRPAALLRIGLVGLLWTKWGSDWLLYLAKPSDQMLIGASFYLSTFFLLFGIFTRVSAAWTALTMLGVYYWIGHHEGVEPYIHHHTGLLVLGSVLLALMPSGRSYSVDRWWALRRADRMNLPRPLEHGPLWGQRLLALQVSVLYLATSYDKLNPAFLSGERLEHQYMSLYVGSDYPTWSAFSLVAQVLAVATIALEAALGIGLWWPRARLVLIPIGILFHGLLFVSLPVGTFSCTMWLYYLAFLNPDAVHRFLDDQGRSP